jgi:cAMP-specific phosphodiesterase 4
MHSAYLVKSRHELALTHNDTSPLENMHCAALYKLLRRPDLNILASASDCDWHEARKIILTAILGTDMRHHFSQIAKTKVSTCFSCNRAHFLSNLWTLN